MVKIFFQSQTKRFIFQDTPPYFPPYDSIPS